MGTKLRTYYMSPNYFYIGHPARCLLHPIVEYFDRQRRVMSCSRKTLGQRVVRMCDVIWLTRQCQTQPIARLKIIIKIG